MIIVYNDMCHAEKKKKKKRHFNFWWSGFL